MTPLATTEKYLEELLKEPKNYQVSRRFKVEYMQTFSVTATSKKEAIEITKELDSNSLEFIGCDETGYGGKDTYHAEEE